jgi:hypothetical protein
VASYSSRIFGLERSVGTGRYLMSWTTVVGALLLLGITATPVTAQTQSAGAYQVTVNEVRWPYTPNQTGPVVRFPPEGMSYVAVNVTITNTSAAVLRYRAENFRVRDSEGYQYPLYTSIPGGPPEPVLTNGELSPVFEPGLEDRARGWVTFEVLTRARGLTLDYVPQPDAVGNRPPTLSFPLQQ